MGFSFTSFSARALAPGIALALALSGPGPTSAASATPPSAPPAEARTQAGLLVEADLRDDYLKGQKILIHFTVRNPSGAPQRFPDLSKRPWLVEFTLTDPEGRTEIRKTTPPEVDPGTQWSVTARGQKRVLLEVPSAEALTRDRYTFTITLKNGEETLTIGPRTLRLVAPQVVALSADEKLQGESPWHLAWVHKAGSGFDLFLVEGGLSQPSSRLLSHFLLHSNETLSPWLSAALPADARNRWIFWQGPDGRLMSARLDGYRLREAPTGVGLPYPSWSLLGRGATDASGALHVPIWVPAPGGKGGEVRVVSLYDRKPPQPRRVARFDARPQAWCTADASGSLRLLLLQDGKLDLYAVQTQDASTLPASGRRIGGVTEPGPLLEGPPPPIRGASFSLLPPSGGEAGGLAVFYWSEALGETHALEGRWVSLEGRPLGSPTGFDLPKGLSVRQVVPAGAGSFFVLARDARGQGLLFASDGRPHIETGPLRELDLLRVDEAGQPVLLEAGSGVLGTRRPGI